MHVYLSFSISVDMVVYFKYAIKQLVLIIPLSCQMTGHMFMQLDVYLSLDCKRNKKSCFQSRTIIKLLGLLITNDHGLHCSLD